MHNRIGNADEPANWNRAYANEESLPAPKVYPPDNRPKCLLMAPWGTHVNGGVNLNDISLYKHDGIGLGSFIRTIRGIHEDGVRDFIVSIPLHARTYLLRDSKETCCEPGAFRILSLAKPFSASATGFHSRDQFSLLVARVSGAALRKEVPGIDDMPNIPIKIRSGTGLIMKSLIEVGLAEGKALSPPFAQDFSKTVIRSIANAVLDAPEFEQEQAQQHKTSFERILESARLFIETNLSNPLLDNALVASHCKVSERYLQRAFSSLDLKVAAYIRERRLQQCRADLKNPKMYNHSIADMAMRWGFENAGSFSRAYKERFGRSPSEELEIKNASEEAG